MSQKSYDDKPKLYLIPTPIGNLDDITLRTIKVLNEVEIIFSEDTRITRLLLNHLGIKKKLISNHKYNETDNKQKIIEQLEKGYSIGLVSDRGMPIISDPGYEVVNHVISSGYNVIALPGATAFVCALITSGISALNFSFYGFLNSKETKRIEELNGLKENKETLIFYESPHRLTNTLSNMLTVFGNRRCSVAREISKKFEEIYRGNIDDIIEETKDIKGEIVIIIEGNNNVDEYDDLTIEEHINTYIKNGFSSKDAIKKVAKERKINKNDIYMQYHGKE